jgi:hypothetical protein
MPRNSPQVALWRRKGHESKEHTEGSKNDHSLEGIVCLYSPLVVKKTVFGVGLLAIYIAFQCLYPNFVVIEIRPHLPWQCIQVSWCTSYPWLYVSKCRCLCAAIVLHYHSEHLPECTSFCFHGGGERPHSNQAFTGDKSSISVSKSTVEKHGR